MSRTLNLAALFATSTIIDVATMTHDDFGTLLSWELGRVNVRITYLNTSGVEVTSSFSRTWLTGQAA